PRRLEPRRQEPASGGPRRFEGGPLPLLDHIEPDRHFRRTFIMLFGGIFVTIFLFLSLPLTQKLSERGLDRSISMNMDRSRPPPPPPPELQVREEPKPEETVKPELKQEVPKLSLNQLEAALNPGFGGTGFADFSLNLGDLAAEDLSRIFELTELDRPPVPVYQQVPVYPYALKNAGIEGYAILRFVVTPSGTVTGIKVISSTRYEFEHPAILALQKWRFESGVRHGTRVSSWMEQRINFLITERD
ncbi:MAG TPA: TonB family protein, partial [Opitutaceae bacterium]